MLSTIHTALQRNINKAMIWDKQNQDIKDVSKYI